MEKVMTFLANLLTARLGQKSLIAGGISNLGSAAFGIGFLSYSIANPETKVQILLNMAGKAPHEVMEFSLVIPSVIFLLGTIWAEFLRRAGTKPETP